MKHLFRSLTLALGLVAVLALPAAAQVAVTQTTLSAAVGVSDPTWPLTSVTGIAAGSAIYADSELAFVTALSGLNATVTRGSDGTAPAAHASGEVVTASVSGSHDGPFWRVNPPNGTCVVGSETFSLRVNTRTGDIWRCNNSTWMAINDVGDKTFKNYPGPGAPVASVAGLIAPVAGLFHITGALAITGITVPAGCATGCQITIIPDGAFTTTTATNIAIASTAVVSKALIMTWEPVAGKWYPSY